MKKILTLFVMFLATWDIVCAQMPVFGYQAVVRNADNELVTETPVSVTISVLDGTDAVVYKETQGRTTNALGMMSVLVGTGSPVSPFTAADLNSVDWKDASIHTEYSFEVAGAVQSIKSDTAEILPVPYALQAGRTELTTEMIANYLDNPQTRANDFNQVMQALQDNAQENNQAGELADKIQTLVVNYIKAHKDIALEVAEAWLSSADSEDVMWAYNAVNGTEAFDTAVKIAVQFAKNHKDGAVEILAHYLSQTTPDNVQDAIEAIAPLDSNCWDKVVFFSKNNRSMALQIVNYYLKTATTTEMTALLSLFNSNQALMKAFVYGCFYSYLDYYLLQHYNIVPNSYTDQQIRDLVNPILDNQQTNQKYITNSCDVDVCNMREKVNELMNSSH